MNEVKPLPIWDNSTNYRLEFTPAVTREVLFYATPTGDVFALGKNPLSSPAPEIYRFKVDRSIPVGPVAGRVVEAVKDNDLYIFTHPEMKAATEARFQRILDAFDKSAKSPALSVLPPREPPALPGN